MKQKHETILHQLTGLPTAAGREQRVIRWIEQWVAARPAVRLRRDCFGNLMLSRRGPKRGHPIIFEAHMDHPAFVVQSVNRSTVSAEFRGGVHDSYFPGASVLLHPADGPSRAGRITSFLPRSAKRRFQEVTAVFDDRLDAAPGDVMTWDLPSPGTRQGCLHAPACDDLAAVAAALAAFDLVNRKRLETRPDLRVLLTRAEEAGFIGALGACHAGFIPKTARIVALENSKSFPESPIGGGPIVRVGDRSTIFHHRLTYAIERIAEGIANRDRTFRWQRKLMPGGSCEAGAFQELGFTATCLCLPLGNYHNMNEDSRAIEPEYIALNDYHGLIRLLASVAVQLDDTRRAPSFRSRLDQLFEQRRDLLGA